MTLDVTAELDGFFADAAVTVAVGTPRPALRRLAAAARAALRRGLDAAVAGAPVNAIGAAVEGEAHARDAVVLGELTGHGIGRTIHEEPTVPSVYVPGLDAPLRSGTVLTVEPILALGAGAIRIGDDGWTVLTADGGPVAHAEHTIVVTEGRPLLLTASG